MTAQVTLDGAERELAERGRELANARRDVEALRAEASGRRLNGQDARHIINRVRVAEATETKLQREYDAMEARMPDIRAATIARLRVDYSKTQAERLRSRVAVVRAERALEAARAAHGEWGLAGERGAALQTLVGGLIGLGDLPEQALDSDDPDAAEAEAERFSALATAAAKEHAGLVRRQASQGAA